MKNILFFKKTSDDCYEFILTKTIILIKTNHMLFIQLMLLVHQIFKVPLINFSSD